MNRTILINDEKALEIYNDIIALQAEANPHIDRWSEIEEKKQELKQPFEDYKKEVVEEEKAIKKTLDEINQKADSLKQKLAPFLKDEVEPQLSDTEEFENIEVIDGQLYANIYDAVERFKDSFVTKRLEQKVASSAE
jgi:predicted  nucleic acid-binding Zn-ribbon protein